MTGNMKTILLLLNVLCWPYTFQFLDEDDICMKIVCTFDKWMNVVQKFHLLFAFELKTTHTGQKCVQIKKSFLFGSFEISCHCSQKQTSIWPHYWLKNKRPVEGARCSERVALFLHLSPLSVTSLPSWVPRWVVWLSGAHPGSKPAISLSQHRLCTRWAYFPFTFCEGFLPPLFSFPLV